MKDGPLVSLRNPINPMFPSAQLPEILCCLGNDIVKQLHFHSSCWCVSDVDVEEDDGSGVTLWSVWYA